ncbi:transmembrane protein 81 [Latimeria chalumnae]|uniref:Transmembrane protein 81 n=1 Tax=Latimeria chalumnae TaxID=7897 RepID=H3AZL3_LATCH|nr:PREDICTED: transmembrane protein 81 [Latimeria chalumnae]|eukprot:XP_005989300.1 PREDICTED: transmembrane protein 81 [Latimeria chalumnae]
MKFRVCFSTVFLLMYSVAGESEVTVTINPTDLEQMKTATGRVAVSSSPCSVTCGLGFRLETVCTVDNQSGKRTQCQMVRTECLSSWICGMKLFTLTKDSNRLVMSCMTNEMMGKGAYTFLYAWKIARGIITKDDALFEPYRSSRHWTITIPNVTESHSGTYRCDVQEAKGLRLIQRQYFGVKVIPPNLVDMNRLKSLIMRKEEEKNTFGQFKKLPWQKKLMRIVLLGVALGVVATLLTVCVIHLGVQVMKTSAK